MIKHIVILFTFIFANFVLLGQKEELTLEDAVLQQYRKFYPKKLSMFQWIGKTSTYTYLDNYTKLMKASVKNNSPKELSNIEEFNKKMDAKFYWFSGLEWKNENEFWINDGTSFYIYNPYVKTGKLIHKLDENNENATFHNTSQNIAFTIGNNL